ncbi:VOC family protein [Nocardioides lijunqiniae]|uniref:VOC family protein n=1 Tax=Nocardioides lijunqiniae TaxID=2760832 RepID=UPI0018780052|nr:VOC family protein [Nocardioides lijunqiniae]
MLRGLTTVTFYADDLDAAAAWYADLLGIAPYYRHEVDGVPAYVEFRIGDLLHELGFVNAAYAPPGLGEGNDRATTHWAVDDVHAAYQRLLDLGATPYQPPLERGPGFATASVRDPFGNVLGIMLNQHYLDVIAAVGPLGELRTTATEPHTVSVTSQG